MRKRLIHLSGACLTGLFILFVGGCVKKTETTNNLPGVDAAVTSAKVIMTPFGPRDASQVHYIESGSQLIYDNGHLKKIHAQTGKVVMDFGEQLPVTQIDIRNRVTANSTRETNPSGIQPPLGSGWITDAEWLNGNNNPITYFSTNWKVPTAPSTNDGQLLYIFNGLEDGLTTTSHILQPVLQYGSNGTFGGNYWVVDNWYASCKKCAVYYGTAAAVASGTNLQGVMQQTAQNGTNYSYESSFAGYPASNSLTVANVPELYLAFETMEAYTMTQYSDYPSDLSVNMTGIQILNGANNAAISWIPINTVTDVNQHTVVVSDNSPNGEVDLYFHNPNPASPEMNNSTGCMYFSGPSSSTPPTGIITAAPGTKVTVTLSAGGPPYGGPYPYSTTFGIQSSNVSFQGGATAFSAKNQSNVSLYFIMPACGGINWSSSWYDPGTGSGSICVH
jgi:hypothetical protein